MTNSVEFFETKIIRWKNDGLQVNSVNPSTEDTQECTILLQNDNGPCPLVALANTIILREVIGNHTTGSNHLSSYTYGKDKILVDSILSRLGDILAESLSADSASTNADSVFALLPNLVTGLNVNPKFDGTFEQGPSLDLFNLYHVGLVHGWICDPEDPSSVALAKAGTYDEAQSVLLRASEEPENDELQAQKIVIEEFLQNNATELTWYGISRLIQELKPLQPQVLFRNDHFSTIYKHNDTLYILVTDMGYKREKNIVWQTLTSVSGADDGFFDYSFIPHQPSSHHGLEQTTSHDKDYQLAKQLQEKEDAKMASEMSRSTAKSKQAAKSSTPADPTSSTASAAEGAQQGRSSDNTKDKKKKKKPCSVM